LSDGSEGLSAEAEGDMGFASTALQKSRSLCLHPCTWAGTEWGWKAPKSFFFYAEEATAVAGWCLSGFSESHPPIAFAVCPRVLPALLQKAFPCAFRKA